MGLTIPFDPTIAASEVWGYVTRNLTNPAAAQDLLNMLVGISPTATGRAAKLDLITAARMAELDPANLPGDITTLLARLTLARATYLDYLNNPQLINVPNVSVMEHPLEFPSADVLDDINVAVATATTERTITVALPTGATIRRALLLGVVVAMNNTANAQKIDVTVQGRKGAGGWSNFFSETDCMGFGAVDGSTCPLVTLQDVTALVDVAASYGFRMSITQSAAQSVRYTTYYLLVVTYRMS